MREIDSSNLRSVILEYLNYLPQVQETAKKIIPPQKNYSNLIICGMGGSALFAELTLKLLEQDKQFKLPAVISRSYTLPILADKDSLIFLSSYSGNTEETISCAKQAMALGSTIIIFSKGGTLKNLAQENGLLFVDIGVDAKIESRYATTYGFIAMHQVLTNIGLATKTKNIPAADTRRLEIMGEELASKIKDSTPVIYSSNAFDVAAKGMKIKINENAKTPAFWNYFPELNHNEMVGFTNPQGKFFILMLQDAEDHPRIQKRMKITLGLLKENGSGGEIIKIEGKSYLDKLFFILTLGDWLSYYLALEYKQDPTPLEMVDALKKKLD